MKKKTLGDSEDQYRHLHLIESTYILTRPFRNTFQYTDAT